MASQPNPTPQVYLAAVVDVFSRRVLAHRVSITMEAAFSWRWQWRPS
ncbi:hypothetical protein QIH91_29515 [Bradyrhizobium japonicum USDA 135]|nr:hypothetical protein QIH91_29515 [Bradyrhizobium japonicum USDA 135]